jgi:hypothetical protein
MSLTFNWEIYRELNQDLVGKLNDTPRDYYHHFVHNGRHEGRPWNLNVQYPLFKWYDYKMLNPDLAHMAKHELELHWLKHGRHEGRAITFSENNVPNVSVSNAPNVITFVIPSLNRPTLTRTIHSLLAQRDPHWQCIIVYDGCEGRQFADKRIQTVFLSKQQGKMKIGDDGKEHGQAGRVRNVGLKLCRTPWIGFVDDDDTLDENYVHHLFSRYAPIYDVVVWRMTHSDGNVLPPAGEQRLELGSVGISFCFRNIYDLYFANNAWCEDYNFLKKLLQRTPRNRVVLTKEIFYYVSHQKPTATATANIPLFVFSTSTNSTEAAAHTSEKSN